MLLHGCAALRTAPLARPAGAPGAARPEALVCELGAGPSELSADLPAHDRSATLSLWLPGFTQVQHGDPRAALAAVSLDTDLGRLRPDPGLSEVVDGGLLVRAEVPRAASWLRVATREAGGGTHARFTIRLTTYRAPPAAERARALTRAGDAHAALAWLDTALGETSVAGQRARLLSQRGRAALAAHDPARAEADLRAARALHLEAGQLSEAFADGDVLFFLQLTDARDLTAAAATLDEQEALCVFPRARARQHHSRALLALELGDFRGALTAFAAAARLSRRIGDADYDSYSASERAHALARLGRFGEAVTLYRLALASATDAGPCDRAQIADGAYWALAEQTALQRLLGPLPDPGRSRSTLDEAHRDWQAHARDCADPLIRATHLYDVVTGALALDEPARARAALAELRALRAQGPKPQVLLARTEGKLALYTRRIAAARAAFARQLALAEAAAMPAEAIDAELGLGQVAERAGDSNRAIEHYRRATAHVDRYLGAVALGIGRGSAEQLYLHGTTRLAELLARTGRADLALATVQRARARLAGAVLDNGRLSRATGPARQRYLDEAGRYARLRQHAEDQAAQDWRLAAPALARARVDRARLLEEAQLALDRAIAAVTADERPAEAGKERAAAPPPSPRPGELWLALLPARDGTGAWLALFADAAAARGRRIPLPPGVPRQTLAARLFAPLADVVAQADRIVVLDDPALHDLALHAAPDPMTPGRPLAAQRSLAYRLALAEPPAQGDPVAQRAAPRTALLVGDPASDLPASAREVDAIGEALAALPGWRPLVLRGDAARRPALLELVPGAALLHFAGHATLTGQSPPGTPVPAAEPAALVAGALGDGLDDALELAGGARLTVQDVLLLPSVPPLVVLSACSSGAAAAPDTPGHAAISPARLGLAQAFVLRGARAVLATSSPVADVSAARFATSFHAHLRQVWLRQAEVRSEGPSLVLSDAGPALEAYRQAVLAAHAADLPGWQSFRVLVP